MLVVLEGLDGAGKSTQVKKLRNYLESLYGSLEYIHFPRYDAPVYGDLISRFLRGDFGSNEAVHPQLVALLFHLQIYDALDKIVVQPLGFECFLLVEHQFNILVNLIATIFLAIVSQNGLIINRDIDWRVSVIKQRVEAI